MINIISKITHALFYLFGVNIWLALITLIASIITIQLMYFYCLLLFLDKTYRPDSAQYPFNVFFDRYIPLMAIFAPTILLLLLNPQEFSLLEKFLCILGLHIFILLPIMSYWSKHRHWTNYTFYDKLPLKRWQSPELYLEITVAIIYPTLWGVLLAVLRYLRLGKELNINDYLTDNMITLICIIIISLPLTFHWIKKTILNLLLFKKFLWKAFSRLTLSLGILLLKNKIFFLIMSKLHQISFIWITFMICHPFLYKRTYLRSKIHMLYLKKYKLILFLVTIIIIELFITSGKLYYSLYFIAICVPLRAVIMVLDGFCGVANTWVEYCCNADYINNHWDKPYYPKRFWLSFDEIRENFNGYPLLDNHHRDHATKIIFNWAQKGELTYKRNIYIFNRLVKNNKTKFSHLLRLVYHKWTRTGLE